MTLEGVDWSQGYPGAKALVAAGKRFVVRYVPYNNVEKGLTNVEKLDLLEEGLSIAMVFEMFGDDALAGYNRGLTLGQMAQAGMDSLGFPRTMPVYFAVDWDANTSAEFNVIDAYLRGAQAILGDGRVGIYGGIDVINHCHASGSADWFWQTYAWSRGLLSPYAHLYQYFNYSSINGYAMDLDRSYKDDFGQFPRPRPIPDTAEPLPGGLPVTFKALPGASATILKAKPRRNAASLAAKNLGSTTKDTGMTIWGEVTGPAVGPSGSKRWMFGPQYITSWKVVYIPLTDLKNRVGFK